jgi:hypothetical protein
MTLHVYQLDAPHASAAGTTIVANVASFGPLPGEMNEEYAAWLAAHQALQESVSRAQKAHDIDPGLDRAVTAPAAICDEIQEAYERQSVTLSDGQHQRLADAVLVRSAFPSDLRKVVNVAYVVEWAAVRDILQKIDSSKELQEAIARLALGEDVDLIRALHGEYGKALGVTVATLSPEQDPALRLGSWNQSFRQLLVAAEFLSKTHKGLLEVFARPYSDQLARQQASRKKTPKL